MNASSNRTHKRTLEDAERALIDAVAAGGPAPTWAEGVLLASIEENCWGGSVAEGFWIDQDLVPPIVELIESCWFEGVLPRHREEELIAGSSPSDSEKILFRNLWLEQAFNGSDAFDDQVTFYHAFQLGTPEQGCILLAGLLGDSRYPQASVFSAFTDLETALNWLRIDGFLEKDFRRWREG